eukprot:CAMPEP_0117512372 /NCGR_PEP_ID=MMETSP0784-20121206/28996_1 /TAXON_ID=39447 /ORGANISM="" /LENGTH=316 /DNA_ID=CAMNT_0005308087 /DNA_START=54 /DNA_END=1004 /DNA_ORIENTATION=-
MAARRATRAPTLFVVAGLCWAFSWASSFIGFRAFAGGRLAMSRARAARAPRMAGGMAGLSDLSPAAMTELMKDPEKMKMFQAEVEKIMQDPEKQKALENWQAQVQSSVEKLQKDPEMKEFFEEMKNDPEGTLKKYENDENILRKFSMATGGPGSMPGMMGGATMPGGGAPARTYRPGDEVIIKGLSKAPELNGKKAMVVPPTSEEKKTLEGTNRLIVRLLDTGDQFAVKPENVRTTAQEVDDLMAKNLEDVSVYNPALQTEAAKLRDSGALEDLQNDPELKPIFDDIKKNGMAALEKYWEDEALMKKINTVMAASR